MIIVRKGVSLGAGGVTGSMPWQTFQNNAGFYGPVSSFGTNTNWTKIWVDWPTLQPTASTPLGQNFGGLDSQVQAANAAGRYVILTIYRTPEWAGSSTEEPTKKKSSLFHIPNDLSATGPWGLLVKFLLSRYCGSPLSAGLAWAVEICNEPNSQMWPQRSTNTNYGDGDVTIGCVAATMIESAQAIHDGLGIGLPLVLGPATSDTQSNTVESTSYDVFMDRVFAVLQSASPHWSPGPYTAWSHHNYNDVEFGRHGTQAADPVWYCIAADVRRLLVQYGWLGGWNPGTGEALPMIWLTEGGARWGKLRQLYGSDLTDTQLQQMQSQLLSDTYNGLQNGVAGHPADGTGIALFTQYLFYTDPSADAGLLYAYGSGLGGRLAYGMWANLPNP